MTLVLVFPCVILKLNLDLKVLFVSSLATSAVQIVWLLSLLLFASYRPIDIASGPPISHCTPGNTSLHGAVCTWDEFNGTLSNCGTNQSWICSDSDCLPLVRICRLDEAPTELLGYLILPCAIGLLLIGVALSFALNRIANRNRVDYFYMINALCCCCAPVLPRYFLHNLAQYQEIDKTINLVNKLEQTVNDKQKIRNAAKLISL